MNLFVARVVEVWEEEGVRFGKVDVEGARMRVWLEALPDARPGDHVLVHAGVGIAMVQEEPEGGGIDVPGRSR